MRVAVTTRRFHVRELERLTGIQALEGQAMLLLNDLREYRAWLEWCEKRPIAEAEGAERWLRDVFEPTLARLAGAIGPERDPVQAYCDVLEHKWLLSETGRPRHRPGGGDPVLPSSWARPRPRTRARPPPSMPNCRRQPGRRPRRGG